jgi:hypothetical protein
LPLRVLYSVIRNITRMKTDAATAICACFPIPTEPCNSGTRQAGVPTVKFVEAAWPKDAALRNAMTRSGPARKQPDGNWTAGPDLIDSHWLPGAAH